MVGHYVLVLFIYIYFFLEVRSWRYSIAFSSNH